MYSVNGPTPSRALCHGASPTEVVQPVRLQFTADCAGEIRLSVLQERKRSKVALAPQAPLLVCSDFLQDPISKGYKGPRPGYGLLPSDKSLTRLAKRRLREFGALVDQGGLEKCVFITGTLPGSTLDAQRALAQWTSWLTSRLSQWFRDRFPGAVYFGVWEHQKRGALHLHVCVRTQTPQEATRLKVAWKKRWISLLDGVSNRSGVDLFARKEGDTWQKKRWIVRTDAQIVEKSVARYLSKYTSKGNNGRLKVVGFSPGSWWFASQALRCNAREQRQRYTVSGCTLAHANAVFDSLASQIVSDSKVSYPLLSAWDHTYKGIIAMLPAAAAGALVRVVKSMLRALILDERPSFVDPAAYWDDVTRLFDAQLLQFG